MKCKIDHKNTLLKLLSFLLLTSLLANNAKGNELLKATPGNFGLPGIIDLPTAHRFPDGELIITQQLHKSLARIGLSFQALPRVGLSFLYAGHGRGGHEAYGRLNHDRSFHAHISLLDESKFLPAISLGLRDFIGTGTYSSEYLVASKSIGNIEGSAGIGFGRLAGRETFSNPLGILYKGFYQRQNNSAGRGGTLSNFNWFQGDASAFFGINYQASENFRFSLEYTPDLMSWESSYLDVKSPLNFGASIDVSDNLTFSGQYLHGSQVSLTANVVINPDRPPNLGGKELAPVPMRIRADENFLIKQSNEDIIRKVLRTDSFKVHKLMFQEDTVYIDVTNTKFRSTAQALGRIASTLQRFTADSVNLAKITFHENGLHTASYLVDLEKITHEQFNQTLTQNDRSSTIAIEPEFIDIPEKSERFSWGIGPYVTHRLFNPDLPLSMEAGLQVEGGYQITPGLNLSGALRKSILTNLTDNRRRSNSRLPRVHSDWALYDFAGQPGHIHEFKLSYIKNLAPSFYGRLHFGLLEPSFAGFGGEILYKPAQSPVGVGLDLHHVQKRDYDMKFDLLDYNTTVGHLSLYYDAGGMFDIEINLGRYLAGDFGATTTISRKFGSGWEVGGYATLTDVPFDLFGEGSFDKAIYASVPIDWIISSPSRIRRRLNIRPITRDGGANLASARRLNKQIERYQNADFQREFGRLWK